MLSLLKHGFNELRQNKKYQSHLIGLRRYQSTARRQIGFIGLGQMGRHMAAHLLDCGFNPIVYDQSAEAVQSFIAASNRRKSQDDKPKFATRIAESVSQIAEQSNVIFTMLPMGSQVRDVYFGPKGIFGTTLQSPGPIYLVDCSTIGPSAAQELSRQVIRAGHRHVDAPVTGAVIGAKNAKLNFLCGGEAEDIDKLRDLFMCMGNRVFHCGPSGSGQTVKLCNNAILAATMISVSESLNLARSAGLDLEKVSEILSLGSAKSWVTDLYNPVPGVSASTPASNNYKEGFKTELMEKDLLLTLEASQAYSVDLPFTRLAKELYHGAVKAGAGKRDFSVIYQYLSDQNCRLNFDEKEKE